MQFQRIQLAQIALVMLGLAGDVAAQATTEMGFFITSRGVGNGADLGGLAGADAHCQSLAAAVGADERTWRAYLSQQAKNGASAINARDRIGPGPWYNATGALIANDVAELHGANNLTKQTALNEKGQIVNGRGDSPNRHDILTGSQVDGTVVPGNADSTCGNWTSRTTGSAVVGHHDRQGGGNDPTSWNSAHTTRGCSQPNLQSTGGDGLFYCFAADRSRLLLIPLDNGTIVDPTLRMNYVHDVLKTWIGDADLSGEFNSSDFVIVFAAGGYEDAIVENASWATGDWSGDHEFNSSDLVLAFQDGGFEAGTRVAVAAVPEPSGCVLFAVGLVALGCVRKVR